MDGYIVGNTKKDNFIDTYKYIFEMKWKSHNILLYKRKKNEEEENGELCSVREREFICRICEWVALLIFYDPNK